MASPSPFTADWLTEVGDGAIKRLVNSLCRFLGPEDALKLQAKTGERDPLPFVRSRPAGGAYPLKALWDRLNLASCLKAALREREFTAPVAQAVFAMVANRVLSASSKLAIEQWAAEEVFLGGQESPLQVQHFYRPMDFLPEHAEAIQKRVFYHSKDDRIRSHVLICWLALLLVRIAELATGMSWAVIRRVMQRLHLGEFLNEKNRVLRHTALSADQANILKKLKIAPPKPFVKPEIAS